MYNKNKSVELLELEKKCRDDLAQRNFEEIDINIEQCCGYMGRFAGNIKAKKAGKECSVKWGDLSMKELPFDTIKTICVEFIKNFTEKDSRHAEGYTNRIVYQFEKAGFINIKKEFKYAMTAPAFFSIVFNYEGAWIFAEYYVEDLVNYIEEDKVESLVKDIEVTQCKKETENESNEMFFSPFEGISEYQSYVNYSSGIAYNFSTNPTSLIIPENTNCVLRGVKCDFDERFFYRDIKLYYKGNTVAIDDGDGELIVSQNMPLQYWETELCMHAGKQAVKFDDNYYLYFEKETEKEKFLRYIDEHNAFVDKMFSELFLKCEDIYKVLWSREEIPNAVQNFLDMFPEMWLSDIKIYSTLIYKFCCENTITNQYMKLDEEVQNLAREILYDMNNTNAFEEAWGLVFNFASLLVENYDVDQELADTVVYMLMNKGLVSRYSYIWKKDYNSELDVIDWTAYVEKCISNHWITDNDNKGLTALTYALLEGDSEEITGFIKRYHAIEEIIANAKQKQSVNNFAKLLFRDRGANLVNDSKQTIADVDLMNGPQFEQFVCELFKKMKYNAFVTKTSGDQGLDVIAEKDGIKIGVQAKCYSSVVGNSAVQEAVAGKSFYNCNRVLVVTNNYFTKSAVELAKANSIVLWDRDKLIEIMNSAL